MAPPLRTRALAAAVLLIGPWAVLAGVDRAVGRVQREAEAVAPLPPATAGVAPHGRLFVLFVDSLQGPRTETLPAVVSMAPRSLLLRVSASQDAATVPSLRAAFTGHRQRSIFAFVRNFVRRDGNAGEPSLFAQAAARGDRVAVFSDGSFYELAPGITDARDNEQPPGDEETRQVRAFHDALALYLEGRHAIVVFHLTLLDHAAHTHGPATAAYEHAFAVVDNLLREADAAVPKNDTLVMMGDHGHDDTGRHFPGLDVPTAALYRGPRFHPGRPTGMVPLTLHRYLMSWALGLPLAPEYRGVGAPEVLEGGVVPTAFASPPAEISAAPFHGRRLTLLAPLALAIAAAGAFAARRLAPAHLTRTGTLLLGGLGAVAFTAWGAFLAHRRLTTPPPMPQELMASWLVVLVAAALVKRRITATWLVLAVPALLLYPSAAWDGWAAIMAPSWLVAVVLLGLDWWRQRRGTGHDTTAVERMALVGLPLFALLLLPFSYAEADGVVSGAWSGYLSSNLIVYWLVLTLFAKAVLFVRPGRGRAAGIAAMAVIALFTLVSFGGLLSTQLSRLGATAALAAAAFVARRRRALFAASILTNAALLMAWRATVVLEERTFLQLEVLLATLRLTAMANLALGRVEDRQPFAAWLEAMAIIIAAWTSLAFTLHRLEWSVLYLFLPAEWVEGHVGLLLPVIVGRYALPLVLGRRLLAEMHPGGRGWRASVAILTAKVSTLALVLIGSAVLDPSSDPFMGAVQNLLTLSVLAIGLVV